MKRHLSRFIPLWLLLATLHLPVNAASVGTAFTFQGKLSNGANPANGSYDLMFSLHDSLNGGFQVGGSLTSTATGVSNGLFTVTLDFGSVFDGNARWLQISVRTNGGGAFTPLTPRQALSPAPHAVFAANAATLGGQSAAAYAPATGSATYVAKAGDTMSGQLLLPANGLVAGGTQLVLKSGAVGVGGDPGDARLDVKGNLRLNDYELFLRFNGGDRAHGLGWYHNTLKPFGSYSQLDGPVLYGQAYGGLGSIGGGQSLALMWGAGGRVVVDPGGVNTGTLLPGLLFGSLSSGEAISSKRTAGGNQFGLDFYTASTPRLSIDSSGNVLLRGNTWLQRNTIFLKDFNDSQHGLGYFNSSNPFGGVYAPDGPILFGWSGGMLLSRGTGDKVALSWDSQQRVGIGKTSPTTALDVNGTVTAGSLKGTPGGLLAIGTTDGQPVELSVNNQCGLRLEQGGYNSLNLIGGWVGNKVSPGLSGATVAGGGAGNYGLYGDNYTNRVEADFGTVSGGAGNAIWSVDSFGATIAGGRLNKIDGAYLASIGGGYNNWVATGGYLSTIGGGEGHFIQANIHHATIPGGFDNRVAGDYGFAAGRQAQANHTGAFVWADSTAANFASTANNQFLVRAGGGVGINKNNPVSALDVSGDVRSDTLTATSQLRLYGARTVIGGFDGNGSHWFGPNPDSDLAFELRRIAANQYAFTVKGAFYGTSFNTTSDRNAKENLQPVDPQAVLEKVTALPIAEWNFKNDSAVSHIGPMAQDFYAAFAVGPDDKHIATVDADGVALAAIQGLNQKLETKNAALQKEVAELKALVETLAAKVNGGGQ